MEVRKAVHDFFGTMQPTRCRSSVERDSRTGEIELIPEVEAPARLTATLTQLPKGLELIGACSLGWKSGGRYALTSGQMLVSSHRSEARRYRGSPPDADRHSIQRSRRGGAGKIAGRPLPGRGREVRSMNFDVGTRGRDARVGSKGAGGQHRRNRRRGRRLREAGRENPHGDHVERCPGWKDPHALSA